MPCRYVAYFVTQHRGQLRLRINISKDATGYIDIAAGESKGVDLGAIEHGEGVGQIRAMTMLDQLLSNAIYVRLQFRVIVGTVLLDYFRMIFLAERNLPLFRHERQVLFTGHRVGRATDQQSRAHDCDAQNQQ